VTRGHPSIRTGRSRLVKRANILLYHRTSASDGASVRITWGFAIGQQNSTARSHVQHNTCNTIHVRRSSRRTTVVPAQDDMQPKLSSRATHLERRPSRMLKRTAKVCISLTWLAYRKIGYLPYVTLYNRRLRKKGKGWRQTRNEMGTWSACASEPLAAGGRWWCCKTNRVPYDGN